MLDADISKRVWIARYLMVIGIVILHVPPYQALSELDGSIFGYIKAFFAHGVFRASVPVLTVMSGYLIFATQLHLKPVKLFKKKVSTLLVPLILWNLPLAIAVYLVQRFNIIDYQFSMELYPFDLFIWLDANLGLSRIPINYPLNFLRDLFVIALLSPLIGWVLKKGAFLGLVGVFIVYFYDVEGELILRNSMLISFYCGALLAYKSYDLRRLDKYAFPCLLSFVVVCISIVAFQIENRELFRMVSPFMIWPALSLLESTKLGTLLYRYSGNSFFTFLAHGPLLVILWVVFNKLPVELPYYVFWLLTPIIIVCFTIIANRLLKCVAPRVALFVLGNR